MKKLLVALLFVPFMVFGDDKSASSTPVTTQSGRQQGICNQTSTTSTATAKSFIRRQRPPPGKHPTRQLQNVATEASASAKTISVHAAITAASRLGRKE